MIIIKAQEVQKWTMDTQAIILACDNNSLTVVAPGPISAAAGAHKYLCAFGMEVDRVKIAKLSKNKWQINLN